ncbi:MAG: glycosyltransferase family 2 protein [Alphaproteobacteria bacterium]
MFSIITVTLNNHAGLRRTYQSLQTQNHKGFEWIVIDGGSADETLEFLRKNPPETLISEPDQGLYDAMNKGIKLARRDYVLFLNAGDALASPDILHKISEDLKTPSSQNSTPRPYAFLYGDALELEDNSALRLKPARPYHKRRWGMITHHQAMLYHRENLQHFSYDLSYKIAADYDLTLRFLGSILESEILYLPFPICIFEAGGLSQQKAGLGRKEQFKARQKHKNCPLAMNALIYSVQAASLALRRIVPPLYWRLRG